MSRPSEPVNCVFSKEQSCSPCLDLEIKNRVFIKKKDWGPRLNLQAKSFSFDCHLNCVGNFLVLWGRDSMRSRELLR